MDVERLMTDLTIDQIQNIQESLSQQADEKREELRRMVGRRYRDVLGASSTLKRLTELSGELANRVKSLKGVTRQTFSDVEVKLPVKKESILKFGLLHRLMPLATERPVPGDDGIVEVFALVLAENLHRAVSIDASAFADAGVAISTLLRPMGRQLIGQRLALGDQLTRTLGTQTEWREVAGVLVALGLLNQTSLEDLLETYLTARKEYISSTMKTSSSTLISVIEMMKKTADCVDDVFTRGAAVVSALNVVTAKGWCPDEIHETVAYASSPYQRQLQVETERVNALYPHAFVNGLPSSLVEAKCSAWFQTLCQALSPRIKAMCEYFEKTDDVVDFIVAIHDIFSSEWPCVASNSAVYQQLFGSSLLDRYKVLIVSEVAAIEAKLATETASTKSVAPPLFTKQQSARFDSLLASGVSQQLYDLVQKTFARLQDLLDNTNRYVAIGKEANVASLNTALADAVLDMTRRVTGEQEADENQSPSQEKSRWFTQFRVFLAIVQHEPAVLCQCMNRSSEHINECNRLLHSAAERALSRFMDLLIAEAVREAYLDHMVAYVSSPYKFLDIAQAPEKHRLPDSDSAVEIPTQLSRLYFNLLYVICQKTNAHAVGHLFTRNVTIHIAQVLGDVLSKSALTVAHACLPNAMIASQVLLDFKILFSMFLHPSFMDAVRIVEEKLDPINRAVLSEPISKNAKIYVKRTTLLFGQLQVEPPVLGKDDQIPASYASLIDITPLIPNIPRLPLIPGLSVMETVKDDDDSAAAKDDPAKQGPARSGQQPQLASALQQSEAVLSGLLGTKPSISSLYDKFSTSSWWKH